MSKMTKAELEAKVASLEADNMLQQQDMELYVNQLQGSLTSTM